MKNSPSPLTAIITGGAQGIGKGITRRLLHAGYRVFIWENDVEAGEEVAAELATLGKVHFLPCNIADEKQVIEALNQVTAHAGQLNLLVNNAGFGRNKPLAELSLDDWNAVIGTNLTGTFLCSKYCTPMLRKSKGAIVNIASTRAHTSEPNTEAYTASKGGVLALTHALAISLGPEVRVNCISPGWIDVSFFKKKSLRKQEEHSDADREQHPVGRIGTPDDIAEMVLFLASEKAGFITGQEFIIDGGMTRKMIYV
jgi:NAD(P)-dependent dehydrogenase (short-subunit alcohol dehydrogenase family)